MLTKYGKYMRMNKKKNIEPIIRIFVLMSVIITSTFLYCNSFKEDVKQTIANGSSTIKYKEAASSISIDLEEEAKVENQVKPNLDIMTKQSRSDPDTLTKSKGKEIVSVAKQFLNTKYVWGGTTPSGFDCSGFVKYVYGELGYKLNRIAADQAKEGTFVKKGDFQPGDLVFFDTNDKNGNINHVGIYIGDGEFIQSSSKHAKVVISKITENLYSSSYVTARKIVST